VDNTGIDTIFLVLTAIKTRAQAAGQKRAGREPKEQIFADLWDELQERQVILIEIDSGLKPEKPGVATPTLSVLLDPLAALNNAGFTNAELDKKHYRDELRKMFHRRVSLSDQLNKLAGLRPGPGRDPKGSEDYAQLRDKLLGWENEGVEGLSYLTLDCNHYDDDQVMTAWSLPPNDKALLLARFLVEVRLAQRSLGEVEALKTIPERADRVRRKVDDAVAAFAEGKSPSPPPPGPTGKEAQECLDLKSQQSDAIFGKTKGEKKK
jgi:hypothetical protein